MLMAMNYTIGNLHVKFRSQLHLVHLAILMRYQLLNKYKCNYKHLLQPLLLDLKKLHLHGITPNISNCEMHIKAKLCAIHGGNYSCALHC